jgi:CheY-like chemotaxis protein
MEIPESTTLHVGPQSPPTTISEGTTQKRILLVDDNPVNQKVMVKTLRKLGFKNIEVASDGRMGVNSYTKGSCP